jgi:catechol 2,3-dioxygenase-like lactoylglutathione lyase family enzyme
MAIVRILVGDVDRAVATWVNALGFDLVEQMGSAFAQIRNEDLEVWLSGPASSAQRVLPNGRQPEPGGWNRIVLPVDDIVGKLTELQELGIEIVNPGTLGPGGRQALIADGEGNVIELFEAASG